MFVIIIVIELVEFILNSIYDIYWFEKGSVEFLIFFINVIFLRLLGGVLLKYILIILIFLLFKMLIVFIYILRELLLFLMVLNDVVWDIKLFVGFF